VETWNLNDIEVEPHQPKVLVSQSEGRAIVIQLPAGEQLQQHQVHERAWLLVADGEIAIEDAGGESISGGPGMLTEFDPNERREVTARSDSRLLLILAPWPGEGHPSAAR
jgi:redox-sensitive bicupin YhaK (pirin superfamily)